MTSISPLEQVIQWLRDGNEHEAAAVLSECTLDLILVDAGSPIGSERVYVTLDACIGAPRPILDRIKSSYSQEKDQIEKAVRSLAEADSCIIQDVSWLPKPAAKRTPLEESIAEQLRTTDTAQVQKIWETALKRVGEDPEGAITAARSLVETVCKHILDDKQVAYPEKADLPKLYRLVAEQLALVPEQRDDKVMRSILGNCQTIVGNIAHLRRLYGDAHGKGVQFAPPPPHLAELAVNLAGAMTTYLLAVWKPTEAEQS